MTFYPTSLFSRGEGWVRNSTWFLEGPGCLASFVSRRCHFSKTQILSAYPKILTSFGELKSPIVETLSTYNVGDLKSVKKKKRLLWTIHFVSLIDPHPSEILPPDSDIRTGRRIWDERESLLTTIRHLDFTFQGQLSQLSTANNRALWTTHLKLEQSRLY